MKTIFKESGITLLLDCDVEFEFDMENKTWYAWLEFTKDYPRAWDWNELDCLKKSSNVLKSLITLKKLSPSIEIDFEGDRGGEQFTVSITEKAFHKLIHTQEKEK